METELFLIVSFVYCNLAMEQEIVLFSTYLHIFTFVVFTEVCLRNNAYLIMFFFFRLFPLVVMTMVSGFFEVVFLLFIFFTIFLGFTFCASVLIISWLKYDPFSAFTFISSVVTISSFTSASASWLSLFGVLFHFLFSNQASSLFLFCHNCWVWKVIIMGIYNISNGHNILNSPFISREKSESDCLSLHFLEVPLCLLGIGLK